MSSEINRSIHRKCCLGQECVSVVFPSEAHVVTIEAEQALIADGHAMSIPAEVAQHVARPTESGLGINHPVMM